MAHRALVHWCFFMDSVHTAGTLWMLWRYTVDHFADNQYLLTALWPVSAAPLFVGESRLRPRILRYTRSRAVMQHCAWSSFAFRLTQGGR